MRHAYQLNKRIGWFDLGGERRGVERVSDHGSATRRQLFFRSATHQSAHAVAAFREERNQSTTDVASAAGDENFVASHAGRMRENRRLTSKLFRASEQRSRRSPGFVHSSSAPLG